MNSPKLSLSLSCVYEISIGCLNVGERAYFLLFLTPLVLTVALWYYRPLLSYRTLVFLVRLSDTSGADFAHAKPHERSQGGAGGGRRRRRQCPLPGLGNRERHLHHVQV